MELEPSFLGKIIDEIDFKIIKKAISKLDSDEVTNILRALDSEKIKILSEIPKKDRLFIEDNLSYEKNTAGSLMQKEIVKIPLEYDVGNAIDFLRKSNSLPKVFYDLFIIDKNEKIGTVPLCTVISTIRKKKIFTIMKKNRESVHFTTDQEEVADIFRKRNLTSIAVVNDEDKLLGMINVDDVVDVIDDEKKIFLS